MLGEVSRRQFFKISAGGLLSLYIGSRFHGFERVAQAAIPGGTIDLGGLPKYETAMLIPPVMPKAGTRRERGMPVDYYEISMKQFQQQILPAGSPMTTVWGYGAVRVGPDGWVAASQRTLAYHRGHGRTGRCWVKWINDLKDAHGQVLAAPPAGRPDAALGQPAGGLIRAETPGPPSARRPVRTPGPVPMVTHVHGAVGVGDESDGYPEAWYLPAAPTTSRGAMPRQGTWFDFFKRKAAAELRRHVGPGLRYLPVPQRQPCRDHLVPRPLAGHDPAQRLCGTRRFLPHPRRRVSGDHVSIAAARPPCCPARRLRRAMGSHKAYYEIPIAIQDRAFNADGSLFYPDSRAFFDGATVA